MRNVLTTLLQLSGHTPSMLVHWNRERDREREREGKRDRERERQREGRAWERQRQFFVKVKGHIKVKASFKVHV